MARAWILDSRGIAKKVKHATHPSSYLTEGLGSGATRECPKCKHSVDNSDVSAEWPGLPAGVKFDPSDIELIEHLAGKAGANNSKPHPLIDEFIPTLNEEEGICYTHPENLPGIKKDGSSVHFFHRTSNAYSSGSRKRRKIQKSNSSLGDRVRWHKTGKTRPVMENGIQRGCKKILVLYKSAKKSKPDKTNWVMHQYHLGTEEDEKDGELVVSKIFYQQQPSSHMEQNEPETDVEINHRARSSSEEPEVSEILCKSVSPLIRSPKTNTPEPPRPKIIQTYDEADIEDLLVMPTQEAELEAPPDNYGLSEISVKPSLLVGEPQAVEDSDLKDLDASLLCYEVLESFHPVEHLGLNDPSLTYSAQFNNTILDNNSGAPCGISDLDKIDIDTPPDYNLADLQFGSQDSFTNWIDQLQSSR